MDRHDELKELLNQAALREADELLLEAERNGQVLTASQHPVWRKIVNAQGQLFMGTHQQEAGKRCFLRILFWPLNACLPSTAWQSITRRATNG